MARTARSRGSAPRPTWNSLPTRSLSPIPRVVTCRRERPLRMSMPCSAMTASIASASISVIAVPRGAQASAGAR